MPKTYGQVRQALRDAGWRVVRQKGSHQFRVSPDGMRVALGAYLDWLRERGETAPAPSSCEAGFIAA